MQKDRKSRRTPSCRQNRVLVVDLRDFLPLRVVPAVEIVPVFYGRYRQVEDGAALDGFHIGGLTSHHRAARRVVGDEITLVRAAVTAVGALLTSHRRAQA